jgi:hypothetical protein
MELCAAAKRFPDLSPHAAQQTMNWNAIWPRDSSATENSVRNLTEQPREQANTAVFDAEYRPVHERFGATPGGSQVASVVSSDCSWREE